MDAFRAAWAARVAARRTAATLTTTEHWGLRMLAAGSDGPLSAAAATAALAALTARH